MDHTELLCSYNLLVKHHSLSVATLCEKSMKQFAAISLRESFRKLALESGNSARETCDGSKAAAGK